MVLCSYYLGGNCRYGSKCVNDHIDLKALLKTEVDSAINGKQWLLSCFGPFKESQSMPNLPDRSFEEVRIDFLASNENGTVQKHVEELIAQYGSSMNYLNQLKNPSPEILRLIANIYNQSVQEQKKPVNQQQQPQPSSVFGASNFTNAAKPQPQNPFGGNVFGGAQTSQPAGNIFGNPAPTSNPFQSPQSSIFGGGQEKPSMPASSFSFSLGQQLQPQPQQQQQQSIFGSSQPLQSSIFGSSQPIQQQQPSPLKSSIFGSSLAPQQQNSVFGGPPSFGGGSSIFAQPTTQQQPTTNTAFSSSAPAGIFGGSQPNQTFGGPQPNQTFGGPQPNQTFGGPQPNQAFGAPQPNQVFGATQPNQTFGGSQQNQPFGAVASGNLPTQVDSMNPQGLMSSGMSQPTMTEQAMFPQLVAQPSQGMQQQPNVFAPQAPAITQNIFGGQQVAPIIPVAQATGSIFQIQSQQNVQQNPFGNPFHADQSERILEAAYSRPEDLTPEEIAIFKSDSFQLGRVPIKPPPKDLCV